MAERTVELLLDSTDVTTVLEPAVSVIDVVCAALGRDPMASGLRVVDALAGVEPLRGPGPLLVLQTYSSAILARVADRLPIVDDRDGVASRGAERRGDRRTPGLGAGLLQ